MHAYGQHTLLSASINGVEAYPVRVEVAVSCGLPGFCIVGMADQSIREAAERIKAAFRSTGFTMPIEKIVVNLAPCSSRKSGSGFDLPIALGILIATGQVSPEISHNRLIFGELSLEGYVRKSGGLLAYSLCALKLHYDVLTGSGGEPVPFIEGLHQYEIDHVNDLRDANFVESYYTPQVNIANLPDYADISGQEMAKRALVIAATGNHGLLMIGSPGSGKTMLASRFGGILPPLTTTEKLEVASVYSVAGENTAPILSGIRPFRSPHHSATLAGLLGGGSPIRPGEASLAHRGVLFLDELPEFKTNVLQTLRQPMEDGVIHLTRASGHVTLPARFSFLGSANPCPCGYYGDKEHECKCTSLQVSSYLAKIGGPLMDRIDMSIYVSRVPTKEVLRVKHHTSTQEMRDSVMKGLEFRSFRRGTDERYENTYTVQSLRNECKLDDKLIALFDTKATALGLSNRGVMKVLSVARTIADLDEQERVCEDHLFEALQLRGRGLE